MFCVGGRGFSPPWSCFFKNNNPTYVKINNNVFSLHCFLLFVTKALCIYPFVFARVYWQPRRPDQSCLFGSYNPSWIPGNVETDVFTISPDVICILGSHFWLFFYESITWVILLNITVLHKDSDSWVTTTTSARWERSHIDKVQVWRK